MDDEARRNCSRPRNVFCRFVSLPEYVCASGCAIVQRTSKCPPNLPVRERDQEATAGAQTD